MAGQVFLLLLFALAAAVAGVVAAVGWRRRRTAPAVGTLSLVSAAIAAWSAAEGLILLTGDPGTALLLAVVKYVGVGAAMAGFLYLSKAVADRGWRLPRRALPLLSIEPALVTAAIVTNPRHHLFFLSMDWAVSPEMRIPEFGPLFWAHTGYSYLLFGIGAVRLVRAWARGPRAQRPLYGLLLLSVAPSTLGNVVGLLALVRTADLTPVGFCVTAVVVYWLLVHRALPELVPVARDRVFDMIGDAVVTIDASSRILDLNSVAEDVLHRLRPGTPDRVIGLSLRELLGEVFTPADDGESDLVFTDGTGRRLDLNVRTTPLYDRRGERAGWAMVARDVTALNRQRHELERANSRLRRQQDELEQANARLRDQLHTIELLRADLAEQAARDALTGLHNRRHLMDVLHREAATADGDGGNGRDGGNGGRLSLALLDIDHFKQVNDRYGHRVGDDVLVRFAQLLSGGVRRDDTVARYGGEEFVVVFPGTDEAQARSRVEALLEQVAADPVHSGGHTLRVTFSAGVAALSPGQSPDDLLQAADGALYAAKRGGRNRVETAGPGPEPAGTATGTAA
ncbi:GGDEF domain-containing protein [Planomonospora parontospora subsp. parontospora]|uniref:GGDEF domain-containing protein n=2 Tax=Planomonospora parontospora TaxID=58119 RepID=A0AA37BHJ8_9ACTN|nr:diguanylate cyclase [Planomonospora parontospora]GGK70288.1 GGDEF domain-containing protein [Planomonospora parontospora]GII09836.1 GGDEF domain-containing protein [Planomonospora parontospora subsp. parontospora]